MHLPPKNVPSPFMQEELFMFFQRIIEWHELPVLIVRSQVDGRSPTRVRQASSCGEERPDAVVRHLCRTASTEKGAPSNELFLNGRPGPFSPALRPAIPHPSKSAEHLRLRHQFLRHHARPAVRGARLYRMRPAAIPSRPQHTTAI